MSCWEIRNGGAVVAPWAILKRLAECFAAALAGSINSFDARTPVSAGSAATRLFSSNSVCRNAVYCEYADDLTHLFFRSGGYTIEVCRRSAWVRVR